MRKTNGVNESHSKLTLNYVLQIFVFYCGFVTDEHFLTQIPSLAFGITKVLHCGMTNPWILRGRLQNPGTSNLSQKAAHIGNFTLMNPKGVLRQYQTEEPWPV